MKIKILILFETFHHNSGGGITLSNLFKNHENIELANCTTSLALKVKEKNSPCSNFYALGSKEIKSPFPVSLFVNWGKSGRLNESVNMSEIVSDSTTRSNWLISILKRALKYFGLGKYFYSINLSTELTNWIDSFNPDLIYAQPGTKASCLFINDLIKRGKAPVVLHVMDDWISLERKKILNMIFKNTALESFTNIVDNCAGLLTISEGMREEYLGQFGRDSKVFHNTLDFECWEPFAKNNFKIGKTVKLLYAGRIGIGVQNSLLKFIEALSEFKEEGIKVELFIQTPNINNEIKNILAKYDFVFLNDFIEYSKLPTVFSAYDLIILPVDFDNKGKSFLRYSMPTKVPEFMISGTPIVLYCPQDIYLYQSAVRFKWAYIIKGESRNNINDGIKEMIGDIKLRRTISFNAYNYAKEEYEGNKNRRKFINVLASFKEGFDKNKNAF